jgi:hypothetical protein
MLLHGSILECGHVVVAGLSVETDLNTESPA